MTDPKIEKEIALLKKCMAMLRDFHDIFDDAILTETAVPQDEGRLQQLRENLPGEWDSLFRQLGVRRDDSVYAMVKTASSLPAVIVMTVFQRRKLYDLWHKAYMKLHFLLGKLQHRKERLEDLRPGRLKAKKFLKSPVMVIIIAMVVLLLYIVLK